MAFFRVSAELCDSSAWSVSSSANADANAKFVTDCAPIVVAVVGVIAFVLFAFFA